MAIKRQTWRPDTHPGYEIVEEYDDTDYDATVTAVSVKINGVEQGTTQADKVALRQSVRNSNVKKNRSFAELIEVVPSNFKREVMDGDLPTGSFVFKDEYPVTWEKTGEDSYLFRATFLTQQQVNQANAWLANRGFTGVTVTNAVS